VEVIEVKEGVKMKMAIIITGIASRICILFLSPEVENTKCAQHSSLVSLVLT